MSRKPLVVIAAMLAFGVAGCSSPPAHDGWKAKKEAAPAANDECREEVDNTMKLRGYPTRPSPETPQYEYRKMIFAKCMTRKGYAPE